ncbi:hypothetical protein MLD38_013327 [Melastoma candidum]|uniref:Uncharacterized protein n=1 Tax=Melastoma candidum TaxID=119954 RepID=A0ACB9R971_9MYRT|nr:hypothetical protein MLD38_013327 [Melastoma candidum]
MLHKVFVCGYENSKGVRELMKNSENFEGFRICSIFRGRNGDGADQKNIIEMAIFAPENPQGAIVLISDNTDYVQFANDLHRKAFPLYWADGELNIIGIIRY